MAPSFWKTPTRRSQDVPGGIPALPALPDREDLAVLPRGFRVPDPERRPAPPALGARPLILNTP